MEETAAFQRIRYTGRSWSRWTKCGWGITESCKRYRRPIVQIPTTSFERLSFPPNSSPLLSTPLLTSPLAPAQNQVAMSTIHAETGPQDIVERKQSTSDSSSVHKRTAADAVEKGSPRENVEETEKHSWTSYERLRPFILISLALLILGWWISSIVLPATRHRWFVFQI